MALLGASHIHTPGVVDVLAARADVAVVAVWDPDPAIAEKYAARLPCHPAADVATILGMPGLVEPTPLLISGSKGHAVMRNAPGMPHNDWDNELFLSSARVDGATGKEPWTDLPARLPRPLEQFIDAVDVLGSDIALAHAKDIEQDGGAGHAAAGTGRLDFGHYLGELKRSGYRGSILLHGLNESQAEASIRFLRGYLGAGHLG